MLFAGEPGPSPAFSDPRTGKADFVVDGKTCKTWYQVHGDIHSTGRTPLLVIHGGPGLTHDYMLPNLRLYENHSIPVIFYDQIGCGRSSHIPEAPKSFWCVDLFLDELENLVRHLGLQRYDILGHSWGGIIASNFAAARQPTGLRRLVLASCPASTDLATEGVVKHLKEGFPPGTYEMFEKHEREETTDSKEYHDAMKVFHQKHTCTLDPWPEELLTSFREAGKDKSAHRAMNSQSFLRNGGNNKDWSVIPILHQISSPTLLLHSPTDLVHEIATRPYFERIPKVKWVEFYNSSHLAQFEEPERYVLI
ncbi:proline-specific peptidase [Agrocybe pediades]|nr:proline-specific peptidase [Agrocybe pediades]